MGRKRLKMRVLALEEELDILRYDTGIRIDALDQRTKKEITAWRGDTSRANQEKMRSLEARINATDGKWSALSTRVGRVEDEVAMVGECCDGN